MEKRRIPSGKIGPVIVSCDMLTPFGAGSDVLWQGLEGRSTAIGKFSRFDTASMQSEYAAVIEGLSYHQGKSLAMQMIDSLFASMRSPVPEDAKLLVATTKGEIDLFEQEILEGNADRTKFDSTALAGRIADSAGIKDRGMIISAACASAASAVVRAALMIMRGRSDCVLVVACDSITEFVFSGFSSLMALDRTFARPFDRKRGGLSLGEAAAYALIMSSDRARLEGREVIAEISGWGLSDDANHMTGPSRTSEGMILALQKALRSAGCCPGDIGFISAHGTGTVYNDQMEMRAYRSVFTEETVPVYSIKGAIGHTLGAAGLVETIIAARAMQERQIPPTVNLEEPDMDAEGWASPFPQPSGRGLKAIITNAGFSGINTALVLSGV
jgi:3-oxoacyl-(acyl-carrier-protein) synthase